MRSSFRKRDVFQTIQRQFKMHTTVLTLFLQSASSFALGMMMLFFEAFFLARVTQILCLYFVFLLAVNFLQVLLCVRSGLQKLLQSLCSFLALSVVLVFLWRNLNDMYTAIPVALALWAMLLSLSSFISFMQYKSEQGVASLQYLLVAVGNTCFAVVFIINTDHPVYASLHLLGAYVSLLGVSLFMDALREIVPRRYQDKFRWRVRLVPPLIFTAFAPQRLLDTVNEFFLQSADASAGIPVNFQAENPPVGKESAKVNAEVFIHFSKALAGRAGHVDLAIEDTVYSYGTYDKQSMRYNGIAGAGVMYEVVGKAEYLRASTKLKEEVIFAFGLALSEEELADMKAYLALLKARAYRWQCPSQKARAAGQPAGQFADYPSKLAEEITVSFYKFYRGQYKYYWMLGTNCVSLVDGLLRASGMPTILTGIITPGSYYQFLNAEFLRGSGKVLTRTVHASAAPRD